MSADEYRRKVKYFLTLSRRMSRPKDRAAMVEMAALWMGRAEHADQNERIVQQQQETQPKKETEGERSADLSDERAALLVRFKQVQLARMEVIASRARIVE